MVADKILLEDASGAIQTEDASGVLLLEVPAAVGTARVLGPRALSSGLYLVAKAAPSRLVIARALGLARTRVACVGRSMALARDTGNARTKVQMWHSVARVPVTRVLGQGRTRVPSVGTARVPTVLAVDHGSVIRAVGTARVPAARVLGLSRTRVASVGKARVPVVRAEGFSHLLLSSPGTARALPRAFGVTTISAHAHHAITGSCTIHVSGVGQTFFNNFNPPPSSPAGGGGPYSRRIPDHLVRPWRKPKRQVARQLSGHAVVFIPRVTVSLRKNHHKRLAGRTRVPSYTGTGCGGWQPDEEADALFAFNLLVGV